MIEKQFGLGFFFFPPRFRDVKSNEKKQLYLNLITLSTPNLIVFSTPFQGAQWFWCAYKPIDWQPWLLYSGELCVRSGGGHMPLHAELWTDLWEEMVFLIFSSVCFSFFPIMSTTFILFGFLLCFGILFSLLSEPLLFGLVFWSVCVCTCVCMCSYSSHLPLLNSLVDFSAEILLRLHAEFSPWPFRKVTEIACPIIQLLCKSSLFG